MGKQTVIRIVDAIGADRITDKLGVSHHAIRKARQTGRFAGNWFGPIEELCAEAGEECPKHLFNWKSPSVSPEGSLAYDSQDTLDRGAAQARQKCISGGET